MATTGTKIGIKVSHNEVFIEIEQFLLIAIFLRTLISKDLTGKVYSNVTCTRNIQYYDDYTDECVVR